MISQREVDRAFIASLKRSQDRRVDRDPVEDFAWTVGLLWLGVLGVAAVIAIVASVVLAT